MIVSVLLQPGDLNYGDKVLVGDVLATFLCVDLVGNPLVQVAGRMAYTAKWSFLALPCEPPKGRMLEPVSGFVQPCDPASVKPDEKRMKSVGA